MSRIATTLSLCLFSSLALAAPLKGEVYSPEPGILCDKKAGFCADSQGISIAFTQQFLGDEAGQKMIEMSRENFDATVFTLTNGVHCEAKTQQCTVSKFDSTVDAAHTQALFGRSAPAAPASAAAMKGAVFSPETGILCDKRVGICADSSGISMAFTQQFLGDRAQQKQMALMKQGGYNQTYFILSDGVACNTADKKCYVGEFDSMVAGAHTRALFGR